MREKRREKYLKKRTENWKIGELKTQKHEKYRKAKG